MDPLKSCLKSLALLCLFGAWWPLSARAQNSYRLEWGNPMRFSSAQELDQMLLLPDSSPAWIVLKYPTLGYHSATLYRFQKNNPGLKSFLRFHHGKTVRKASQLYKPKYAGISVTGDHLRFFYTAYDPTRDRTLAFVQKLAPSGQAIDRPQILSKEKSPSALLAADYLFVPSNNRRHFALISRQSPEKFQGEVWEITVFNASMELSWTNTVQVPYRSQELDHIEFSLDSLGNLRALSRIYPGRQQRKSLQLNQRHPFYAFFSFFPQDSLGSFHHSRLLFESPWIQQLRFFTQKDQSLRFAGFYAQNPGDPSEGLITFELRPKDTLPSNMLKHPFEFGFYEALRPPGLSLANGQDESAIIPRALLPLSDGSAALLAEQSLLTESCHTDYRTARQYCSYTWFYNDIYLFYLLPDGTLKYKVKLPKRQMTTDDQGAFSSFLYFRYNNALHLFWLDHPKNKLSDQNDLRYMNNPKKAHIVHWTLPYKGIPKTQTYALPQKSGKTIVPMFREFLLLPGGKVFLSGVHRKKRVPGMLLPENK